MPFVTHEARPGEPYWYENEPLTYINGTGPVLSDNTDTTFIRSDATSAGIQGLWAAPLPAIPQHVLDAAHPVVYARAAVLIDDGSATPIFLRLGTDTDGPNLLTPGNDFLVPNGGTAGDYNALLGDYSEDVKAHLLAGTAVAFFASYPATVFESLRSATLFEYGLFWAYERAAVPPARLVYPRTDSVGPANGRLYPPPNTQQTGSRFGSSSPL